MEMDEDYRIYIWDEREISKKIIDKYFKYEKDTYRWIHLHESDAINMKKEHNQQLLENIFFEFQDKNGNKMREYHVNTHPAFRDETKYKK